MSMYVYFITVLMIVISSICRMERFHPEVARTIDLIKTRLNISSIQCKFKSMYIPILPSLIELEDYTTSLEAEFAFNKKGNLCLCLNIETAQYYTDIYKKEPPSSPPSPLLDLFYKQYLKRQSLMNYQPPKFLFDCSYIYNGKPYIRNIYEKEGSISVTQGTTPFLDKTYVDYNGFGYFGDPRYHIGYISTHFDSTQITHPFKHLSEFLEKEGRYYLSHKEGFTTLWHVTTFDDIGALSAEIWIDSDENIRRIRIGFFPIRTSPYPLEEIKKILQTDQINCDSFSWFLYEIEYYDFKEFENGIRVPLLSIRHDYIEIDDTEYTLDERQKIKHIEESHQKGEIDKPTYLLKLAPFRRTKKMREITIQIDPETLFINKEIPENVFIPPEITATRSEVYGTEEITTEKDTTQSWYSKYYSLLFTGVCLLITIILIFATRRYLGWSF